MLNLGVSKSPHRLDLFKTEEYNGYVIILYHEEVRRQRSLHVEMMTGADWRTQLIREGKRLV